MQVDDIRRIIQNAKSQAEQKTMQHNMQYLDKQRGLLELTNQQAELYQKMATVFLRESPNVENMSNIQPLLQRLKQDYSALEGRVQGVQQVVNEGQAKHDELIANANGIELQRDNLLKADQDFLAVLSKLNDAEQALENATDTSDKSGHEFKGKLKEYDVDKRYNYLLKRHFGEQAYKGKWFFRHMDNWLARQVNFVQNRKNQLTLIALIAEIDKRQIESVNSHEVLLQEKDKRMREVEAELHLPAVYEQIRQLREQLAEQQQQSESLFNELAENKDGSGSLFTQTSQQLADIMRLLPVEQLNEMALKTESPEDELLLIELMTLNSAVKNNQESLSQVKSGQDQFLNMYNNINQLSDMFLSNYSQYSGYYFQISNQALHELLNNVINSQTSPAKALDEIWRYKEKLQVQYSAAPDLIDLLSSYTRVSRSQPSWPLPSRSGSVQRSPSYGGGLGSGGRGGSSGGFKTTDRF